MIMYINICNVDRTFEYKFMMNCEDVLLNFQNSIYVYLLCNILVFTSFVFVQ